MRDIIFKIFNHFAKGVDTYYYDGSMWLIFTNEKKWVFELTKDGALWYNFDFFKDCFKYLSLNVIENQHYITEWVEDTIQNGVKSTGRSLGAKHHQVEDTIQNGVKSTLPPEFERTSPVEDTIQNGVKSTNFELVNHPLGVKSTLRLARQQVGYVEDTIQNGVKSTANCAGTNLDGVEDAIQNGVRLSLGLNI